MSRKPQIDPEFRIGKFCDFFYHITITEDRSEFARRLNVSDSTVAHWEVGERFPTAENITRICRTTKTRADDLLQIPRDCRNTPDITGTTAEKIAQLIYEAGLANTEAARMIFKDESITKGTVVRKWILGIPPSFVSIRRICLAFKVSADWLLNI
jgi:transcriptional regulator with XRE-family HTH domain